MLLLFIVCWTWFEALTRRHRRAWTNSEYVHTSPSEPPNHPLHHPTTCPVAHSPVVILTRLLELLPLVMSYVVSSVLAFGSRNLCATSTFSFSFTYAKKIEKPEKSPNIIRHLPFSYRSLEWVLDEFWFVCSPPSSLNRYHLTLTKWQFDQLTDIETQTETEIEIEIESCQMRRRIKYTKFYNLIYA